MHCSTRPRNGREQRPAHTSRRWMGCLSLDPTGSVSRELPGGVIGGSFDLAPHSCAFGLIWVRGAGELVPGGLEAEQGGRAVVTSHSIAPVPRNLPLTFSSGRLSIPSADVRDSSTMTVTCGVGTLWTVWTFSEERWVSKSPDNKFAFYVDHGFTGQRNNCPGHAAMSCTNIQWLLSPKATLRVTLSTKTWDREGSWLNVSYPFPFPVANTIISAERPGLG